MSTEVIVTLCVLVAEIAAAVYFYLETRKPPEPGKVRVFPYPLAIVVTILLIFLTCAHLISLITGVQVQPRKPKGMR